MKIHRLLLENFRGVVRREIVFPDHGLIVVSGPNEVGKSSLIEALDLLLEEKDSATKAAVRSVKPVRADVGSVIEAEISTGAYRFRYRKQFHRNTATTLTISAPSAEQLTGTPAHERVRQMLADTLDEKLYKALRLLQATPLGQAELADSAALATALDLAAGAAGNPADGESLIAAAQRSFRLDHTPGGRPGGEFKAARAELAAAELIAQRAAAALTEIGTGLDRLEHALGRRDRAQDRLRRGDAALAAARNRKDQDEQRQVAAERADQVARIAVAERDRLRAVRQQRSESITALERRQTEVAEWVQRNDDQHAAAAQRQVRMDEQTAVLAGYAQAERRAVTAQAQARSGADRHRMAVELARLDHQLDQIGLLTVELERQQADVGAAGIDAADLRELAAAEIAFDAACRDQQAGAPVVTVAAPPGSAVWVDSRRQQADLSVDYPITEDLVITTADGVTVTIRPARTAAALTAAVHRADTHRRALLAVAGVADLVAARLHHERRRAAAAAAEQTRAALAARLGADSLESLTARRDALRAEGRTAVEDDAAPGDPGVGGSDTLLVARAGGPAGSARRSAADAAAGDALGAVDLAAATAAAVDARGLTGAAAESLDQLREEYQRVSLQAARTASTVAAHTLELHRSADQLAAARAAHADADLDAAVAAAERVATEALQQVVAFATPSSRSGGADSAPGDPAADSAARCSAAEVELGVAQRELADGATAVAEIQGRLDAIGGQGRQDEHERAQSALAAARRRHTGISRRAAAARLLFDTLTSHRDRARESYVAPFTEQLTRLGAAVFGAGVTFEVAPDLTVVRRTLDGTTVAFEQLSTGAREQLAVLIRLAAARLVADADRVPIFLDDALGYADPDRLAGLGAAFDLAAEHTQLVLLTCDPQRLRDLPNVQVISLTRADGGDDHEICSARPVATPAWPAPRPARSRPAVSAPVDPTELVPASTVPALFDAPPGHDVHRIPRSSRARTAHRPRSPAGS